MDSSSLKWDTGLEPYVTAIEVKPEHMDVFGHTNNVIYVGWMEDASWAHSATLGLDWEAFQAVNRIMVARRHEVDYLAPTFAGDQLILGTWISGNDRRLTVYRDYQIIRPQDGVTVLRGRTKWICVALDTGRPKRMPVHFADGYKIFPGSQ